MKENIKIGDIFGCWKVLGPTTRYSEHLYWKCECKCGTQKFVRDYHLLSGTSLTCGCKYRKVNSNLRPYESVYNLIRINNDRKIDITLTYDEFIELIKTKKCHYCKTPLYWAEYNTKLNGGAYHLDRKDNTLGYHKDNLVVCCSKCNVAKFNNFTYEQFLKIGKLIKKWRKLGTI